MYFNQKIFHLIIIVVNNLIISLNNTIPQHSTKVCLNVQLNQMIHCNIFMVINVNVYHGNEKKQISSAKYMNNDN